MLHESPLVAGEVVDAIAAQWAIEDDLANVGMDQVIWTIGHERAREVGKAVRAAGAAENADVVDRSACGSGDEEGRRDSLPDPDGPLPRSAQ